MVAEYKIVEIFDKKSIYLEEKLKEVFISYLIEQVNKNSEG